MNVAHCAYPVTIKNKQFLSNIEKLYIEPSSSLIFNQEKRERRRAMSMSLVIFKLRQNNALKLQIVLIDKLMYTKQELIHEKLICSKNFVQH